MYLPLAVLCGGLVQVLAGILGVGKFIRLVPHPVMLGFVNGLAVVMTRAQLRHFRAPLACGLASPEALAMVGLTSLTMGLVRLVPRLTRAVPPTLAAVSLVSVLASAPAWKSKFYGAFVLNRRIDSTPSTRRLLDGVAMPVPHRSTKPARPCTRHTG